jgi:hypothetical protein
VGTWKIFNASGWMLWYLVVLVWNTYLGYPEGGEYLQVR